MMSAILANNLVPTWEVTPGVARSLNFSLLVNDDKATGNQAARDQMIVTVAASGPFVVTSQTTNTQYNGNSAQTVTWNVANTTAAPVSTANVQIVMSKDNGANFDIVLAASVPNNGSASIILPNENIASARIMVKALNNIYFAVNSSNFSVKKVILAAVDASQNKLRIYPNPASNLVNVSLNGKSNGGNFVIYDASGRMVNKGTFGNDGIINTAKLSTGNYILNLELKSGEKLTEQLMIKK